MRFLVDEGCDAIIVRTMRQLGHDVTFIAEISPGIPDEEVLTTAHTEQRVLVTEDRDFCELVFRDNKPSFGIILVRISDENRRQKATRITDLLETYEAELPNAMATLTLHTTKVRSLSRRD